MCYVYVVFFSLLRPLSPYQPLWSTIIYLHPVFNTKRYAEIDFQWNIYQYHYTFILSTVGQSQTLNVLSFMVVPNPFYYSHPLLSYNVDKSIYLTHVEIVKHLLLAINHLLNVLVLIIVRYEPRKLKRSYILCNILNSNTVVLNRWVQYIDPWFNRKWDWRVGKDL